MKRANARWIGVAATAVVLGGVWGGTVSNAQRSTVDRIDVRKTPKGQFDPVTRVNVRVDELQAQIETLKKQDGELRERNEALRAEIDTLRTAVQRLTAEAEHPGGVQGVRRKVMQKGFWDRVPNDAYLIYYVRP